LITVNGEQHPWSKGMTVADLLEDLRETHNYAVVRIDGKHVSRPYFDKFLVPDNSEIFLLPLIAGG
jgi:thiamine biosynthesis protein ThiS